MTSLLQPKQFLNPIEIDMYDFTLAAASVSNELKFDCGVGAHHFLYHMRAAGGRE